MTTAEFNNVPDVKKRLRAGPGSEPTLIGDPTLRFKSECITHRGEAKFFNLK